MLPIRFIASGRINKEKTIREILPKYQNSATGWWTSLRLATEEFERTFGGEYRGEK